MDLRALRYFIAVVEAGSLSRAAHSLYVAQPALTAQIKKLEGELGAQLLARSHTGVSPTPAGTQLYEDARRLLSDADAMRERIKHVPQGPEGSVTIVPFLLTSLLLGPVIAQLRAQHPRVRVFVIDGLSLTVQKAMEEGRADVGILVDTPRAPDCSCTPLAEEAMYVCGQDVDGTVSAQLQPNAGGGLPMLPFAQAAALPLVLQPRRYAIRQTVEAAAQALGLRLNIVHEHDSARVIRSLYHCGAGFTFTPACSLADVPPWQLQRGQLVPTPRARPAGLESGSGLAPALGPASASGFASSAPADSGAAPALPLKDPAAPAWPGPSARADWVVAQVTQPVLHRQYTLAVQAKRAQDAATQAVAQALQAQAQALMAHGIWRARDLSAPGDAG